MGPCPFIEHLDEFFETDNQDDDEATIIDLATDDDETTDQWLMPSAHIGLSGVERVVDDVDVVVIDESAMDHIYQAPADLKDQISAGLDDIFEADSPDDARQAFHELSDDLDGQADRAVETLEAGLEDAIAVLRLPAKNRKRLSTTNMVERLNSEIRRREKVIRVFPNEQSAWRLIGAYLMEQHEDWMCGRRYFDMDEYYEWKRDPDRNEIVPVQAA